MNNAERIELQRRERVASDNLTYAENEFEAAQNELRRAKDAHARAAKRVQMADFFLKPQAVGYGRR